MKHSLRRYGSALVRISWKELILLAELLFLLVKLLVVQSRRTLPGLVAGFDSENRPHDPLRMRVSRLIRIVDILMRVVFHDRYCMKRSLLLFHFLRRWGYDARLIFGVQKQGGDIQGHAWVEVQNRPLAEGADPRSVYVQTYSYPPPATPNATGPATPAVQPLEAQE
ncbi:MAG TPA: lasso peptide biosynthesis B2 protein [Rhodothermales bacterium]|nr:lasso peptide biosynthesis B2 protein [Rhodothermales bacterium]